VHQQADGVVILLSPSCGLDPLDGLLDMAQIAVSTGLETVFAEDGTGAVVFARKMEQKATEYPAVSRSYAYMLAGLLKSYYGQQNVDADAQTSFGKAETSALEGALRQHAYLPRMFEASAYQSMDKPEQTLKAADKVLTYGQAALACNKAHQAHGILPIKAWALERLDRHKEADAVMAFYTQLVDNGFTGDGTIQCTLQSRRGTFQAQIKIEDNVGPSAPNANDGSFQVGIGWASDRSDNLERMVCIGDPLASPRYDRILQTYLTRAMFAFRANDDRGAHQALLQALSMGRTLIHGSPQSLGLEMGANLDASREGLYLPLLHTTALVARTRGQIHIARQLDDLGRALASAQETPLLEQLPSASSNPKDEDEDTPTGQYTLLLGFEAFEPLPRLVRTMLETHKSDDLAVFQKTLDTTARGSKLIPSWGTKLAVNIHQAWLGELDEATKVAGKMRPPRREPIAVAAIDGWRLLTQASSTRKPEPPSKVEPIVSTLIKSGLYGEAGELAVRMARIYVDVGQEENGIQLVSATRALMPKDAPHIAYMDLDRALWPRWEADQNLEALANSLVAFIDHQHGRIPIQEELNVSSNVIVLLARLKRDALLADKLGRIIAVVSRSLGNRSSVVFRMRVVQWSLTTLQQQPNSDALALLVQERGDVQDLDRETAAALEAFSKAQPDQLKPLAERYLKMIFPGRP
ncbi:MAG: hypothetical protein AAFX99_09985, partial [Myxococcota bacterium]